MLINTSKGKLIFDKIKDNQLFCHPTEISQSLQPNLLKPTNIHPLQASFEDDYSKKGFEYVGKKYTDLGWRWKWRRVKMFVKNILRK